MAYFHNSTIFVHIIHIIHILVHNWAVDFPGIYNFSNLRYSQIKNNKRRGVLGLCTYACRDSIERKCDQLYRLPGYEKYAEWKYKYRKYSSDRDAIQFVGDGHFNRSLLQINEPRCFSTADIMWV